MAAEQGGTGAGDGDVQEHDQKDRPEHFEKRVVAVHPVHCL